MRMVVTGGKQIRKEKELRDKICVYCACTFLKGNIRLKKRVGLISNLAFIIFNHRSDTVFEKVTIEKIGFSVIISFVDSHGLVILFLNSVNCIHWLVY